jgi:mRNA-degrading endonuclease RelE of RelBE toxin-antitoxin system
MKSVTTKRFRKAFEKLPGGIQDKARKTYSQWKNNPKHPGLDFKQIHSKDPIYSVRVGLGYRAMGILKNDTMVWFWIGSHEDYNQLISSL